MLAVTYHNTVSDHVELSAAARHAGLLLPGQELITDDGHARAFGDIGWVDFRTTAHYWPTTTVRSSRQEASVHRGDQPRAGRAHRRGPQRLTEPLRARLRQVVNAPGAAPPVPPGSSADITRRQDEPDHLRRLLAYSLVFRVAQRWRRACAVGTLGLAAIAAGWLVLGRTVLAALEQHTCD